MKTGRLIKFNRRGGDVHAYLFHEAGNFHGVVYLLSDPGGEPIHKEDGSSAADVEAGVRSWIDAHFPRES